MTKRHGAGGRETIDLGLFGKVIASLIVLGVGGLIASDRASAIQLAEFRQVMTEALKKAEQRDKVLATIVEKVGVHDLEIDRLKRPTRD